MYFAHLERCEQSWLLIFDNADDPLLVEPYLPRSGKGSILLTTRDQAPGSFAMPLTVDKMEVQEGIALLLTRAQRADTMAEAEREAASAIVQALDVFPLPLDQAGAYIEETRCSFTDYLQFYQLQRAKLLAQARACDALVKRHKIQRIEAAHLLHSAGIYLSHHALYQQAAPLYQRALFIHKGTADRT